MRNRTKGIYKPVFFPAISLISIFAIIAILFPNFTKYNINILQLWITNKLGWLYVLGMAIFLCLCVFILVSRLGDIKLGQDHEKPEYTYASWFAMLFSAGMGIGLMFYGVAEPLLHYLTPPNSVPKSISAAKNALNITFFHWGLEAWSVYALVGLSMAYFSYRHKLPLLPRSFLYPIFGKRIFSYVGNTVDIFAIIGVMFGLATSLGLGAIQLNAGLQYLFHIPVSSFVQSILIIIITLIATASVASGLNKGIKLLSNFNLLLAVFLLIFILLLGNTIGLMQIFVQNIGNYLSSIVDRTFNLYAYENKQVWMSGWTLFYWGWWISWSPFVGMFIARVSKGRTIREFIIAVLFIPSLFTFLWMTVFGNSAIELVSNDHLSNLIFAVQNNIPVALFEFLSNFPFASFTSIIAIILIVTFFVTSSDSGSMVIDIIATGGASESIAWQRIFWSLLSGAIAIALLLAGGLQSLQTAAIASALPFLIILFLMCFCLIKALRRDYLKITTIKQHYSTVQYEQTALPWQKRLNSLLFFPNMRQANRFLKKIVIPAITEIVKEMRKKQFEVYFTKSDKNVEMIIKKTGVNNFIYSVNLRTFALPLYAENDTNHNYISTENPNEDNNSSEAYYRAEVFLGQGSQQYDIMGYTKEQVIADILTQYEKHLHFLHLVVAERDIIE